MCGSRENQRPGFEGIGNACLPSSLSSLPTPASPCHALLDGAAKWASDVPSGEVGTGGMGRAVVVVAVDASTVMTTGKRVTLFFFLFVLCFCLKEPPVPSLPDPWCLTPSALQTPLFPTATLDPTGNCWSCAWRRRHQIYVLTRICRPFPSPFWLQLWLNFYILDVETCCRTN